MIGKAIQLFLDLFRYHKLKILVYLVGVIFFVVVLFPFKDISDFVSSQIAKATQNQVFLTFDNPGLSFFPTLGMSMENVTVETTMLPPLKANELKIYPSILGLITLKPGVSVAASGLLGGDFDLTAKNPLIGSSNPIVQIDATRLSLEQIMKMARVPVGLKGNVHLRANAEIDTSYQEQPKGDVTIQIQQFVLPPDTVPTMMGPLTLPSLTLSNLNLKGELRDGRITLEQADIGKAGDELSGQIKGDIELRMNPVGAGAVQYSLGSYNFEVRLNTTQSFQNKAQLFLSFLSGYKKGTSGNQVSYAFRISAPNLMSPPKMTAL